MFLWIHLQMYVVWGGVISLLSLSQEGSVSLYTGINQGS